MYVYISIAADMYYSGVHCQLISSSRNGAWYNWFSRSYHDVWSGTTGGLTGRRSLVNSVSRNLNNVIQHKSKW
jgi:hypothetical protein